MISDRGVEGCTGCYVLPPGGNPNDESHYHCYATNATEALSKAREHKAMQAVTA
uniref:hypothetical protein n=1 Tax=Cupriavidus yeoncheonensis TaxID=1462994 RepID=UPI003F4956A5